MERFLNRRAHVVEQEICAEYLWKVDLRRGAHRCPSSALPLSHIRTFAHWRNRYFGDNVKAMVVRQFRDQMCDDTEQMEICCAWCGRFRNPDKSWAEPSSYRSFELTTHGICPSCVDAMADEGDCRLS
jgi:hypothetical protein